MANGRTWLRGDVRAQLDPEVLAGDEHRVTPHRGSPAPGTR